MELLPEPTPAVPRRGPLTARQLVRRAVTGWLMGPLGYPLVGWVYALLFSPLLLKRMVDRVRGRQAEWSEQPVTPEMEAALTSERWGRHRWLQANGLRFHVVEKGRPRDEQGRRRPLVLFLHGFPEFWYSWRHQLEALGGEYYCVAMDLRGYGQSDKPAAREDYAVEVLVADVRAVIRALGYDKAVLVGHDWGGKIAWHVAHSEPSLLSALVVMNFPHPSTMGKRQSIKQALRSWYIWFFQVPVLPEVMLSTGRFRAISSCFMSPTAGLRHRHRMSPTDVAIMVHAFSRPGVATAAVNYYRNMLRPWPRWLQQAMRTKLEHVPTLVLWGEDDSAIGRELSEGMDEAVPGLKVVYVKDCSQWVQNDKPDEVNQAMRQWLQEVLGGGEEEAGKGAKGGESKL